MAAEPEVPRALGLSVLSYTKVMQNLQYQQSVKLRSGIVLVGIIGPSMETEIVFLDFLDSGIKFSV